MSTLVLARKYRPKRFDQMVGQEHVVRALTNALETGRLHHAYLFTGTRGIGKTTVSRILAKSLNCTGADGRGGVTATPCGVCSACQQIDADRFMDYLELDAASNRSIDEIRDLIERAAYKPGVGRYKVFMIDEAHQLTKDAFNALLKTLEEPPEYLKFVLATTDPEKMLPTVLSRCLQFNLRPMAPEVVREHLAQVLQAEAVPADEGALRLLGRAARGSMRDALSLTDQAIAYGGGRLDEATVRAMLGSVDRRHAEAMVQGAAARDGRALLAAVEGLRELGLSAAAALEEMASLLQQMAVVQAVPDALDAADPDHEAALRLASLLAPDETQLLYSMALHGREELGLSGDEYAALGMVLLRFLAFPPAAGSVPAPRPPGARPEAAAASAPASAATAAAPSSATTTPPRAAGVAQGLAAAAPPRAQAAPSALAQARAESRRATQPEMPPWVDEGPPPDDEAAPEPRHAPLRSPAPAAMQVAAPCAPAGGEPDASALAAPAVDPGEAERVRDLVDRWAAIVEPLASQGRITALVRELAWQAGACALHSDAGGDTWTLRVERDSLRTGSTPDKLAAALTAALERPQRLGIEPGVPTDSVARREARERARRQAAAEQAVNEDPCVQELLSQFRTARIVPGSIRPV